LIYDGTVETDQGWQQWWPDDADPVFENTDEFAGFTADQVRDIENRIGEKLDDAVEIFAIDERDGAYRAHIGYDGTNNKANRGTASFMCQVRSKGVEDFKLTDLTGKNYIKVPDEIND
jgi:hypothetical protein